MNPKIELRPVPESPVTKGGGAMPIQDHDAFLIDENGAEHFLRRFHNLQLVRGMEALLEKAMRQHNLTTEQMIEFANSGEDETRK